MSIRETITSVSQHYKNPTKRIKEVSNTYFVFFSVFILCMVVSYIVLCILLSLSSSCVLLSVYLDCPFFIAPSEFLAFTLNAFGVLPR
jgi:hypothetical protein